MQLKHSAFAGLASGLMVWGYQHSRGRHRLHTNGIGSVRISSPYPLISPYLPPTSLTTAVLFSYFCDAPLRRFQRDLSWSEPHRAGPLPLASASHQRHRIRPHLLPLPSNLTASPSSIAHYRGFVFLLLRRTPPTISARSALVGTAPGWITVVRLHRFPQQCTSVASPSAELEPSRISCFSLLIWPHFRSPSLYTAAYFLTSYVFYVQRPSLDSNAVCSGRNRAGPLYFLRNLFLSTAISPQPSNLASSPSAIAHCRGLIFLCLCDARYSSDDFNAGYW